MHNVRVLGIENSFIPLHRNSFMGSDGLVHNPLSSQPYSSRRASPLLKLFNPCSTFPLRHYANSN